MKTYNVLVAECPSAYGGFEVEAASLEEAIEKAKPMASDHTHEVEYDGYDLRIVSIESEDGDEYDESISLDPWAAENWRYADMMRHQRRLITPEQYREAFKQNP